jgi:hypothetical protein
MENTKENSISIAVYGACHATAIQDIIEKSNIMRQRLNIFPVQSCYAISQEQFQELIDVAPDLDLLIYQPVSTAYRGGQFATNNFSILDNFKTESVAVQYYHFELYWPFMAQSANGLTEPPFTYIDYHLAAMIARDIDDAEILDRLQNETCFDPFMDEATEWAINGLATRELKPLPARTSQHILLSEFVRNNYSTKLLGHTYNHPTAAVYDYIIGEILAKTTVLREAIPRLSVYGVDPHSSIQIPVPEFVRRKLSLSTHEARHLIHQGRRIDSFEYIAMSRAHYNNEGADRIFAAIEMLAIERPWFNSLLKI